MADVVYMCCCIAWTVSSLIIAAGMVTTGIAIALYMLPSKEPRDGRQLMTMVLCGLLALVLGVVFSITSFYAKQMRTLERKGRITISEPILHQNW